MKPIPHILLAALAFLGVVAGAAHAQGDPDAIPGLVFGMKGDLYTYDGAALTQLTTYGANDYPVQSPDGRYIAYRSVAREALAGDLNTAGVRPMNVWLLDRRTGRFTQLADAAGGLRYRGELAWSPDSTRLAWTQLDQDEPLDGTLALVVYNVTTRTATTVTREFTHGPSDGGLVMPAVGWGAAGISHLYSTVIMGPTAGEMIFELYDPATGARTAYTVAAAGDAPLIDYVWVMHRGEPAVAFVTRGGGWWVLNPVTGGRADLPTAPTLQAAFGISNITLAPRFVGGESGRDFAWDVTFAAQGAPPQTVTMTYRSPVVRAPFAPALGEGGAWNSTGTVAVQSRDGETIVYQDASFGLGDGALYGGAVWYASAWRTVPDAAPVGCTTAPRLAVGQLAVVADGAPNNLRAGPGLSGGVTAQLPAGTVLEIVGGPVCVDGFHWYEVLGTAWRGWTAEGQRGVYWLAPFTPPR